MKKLCRYTQDRKIAGVCSGLGDYFAIDPLYFRLGFLVSLLFGGLGALAYVVMWILVPEKEGAPQHLPKPLPLYRSESDKVLGGVCGGLGELLRIDPVLFRVGFVLLAFLAGIGVLLYLALWLLLPRAGATREAPASDMTV
jgi:phage shock protein PspC (stress-responsive transcriptional regulator)